MANYDDGVQISSQISWLLIFQPADIFKNSGFNLDCIKLEWRFKLQGKIDKNSFKVRLREINFFDPMGQVQRQ